MKTVYHKIFLIIALFLFSCQSNNDNNWPRYAHDNLNTNNTKSKGVKEVSEILWKYRLEEVIKTPIVIVDGMVYFGIGFGTIYALDAKSGVKRWSFEVHNNHLGNYYVFSDSPSVCNGVLFIGTNFHELYALDAQSGEKLWIFKTEGEVMSSPVVYNNVVYFGSRDNYFYAVNIITGLEKWKFKTDDEIQSSPIIYDEAVIFRNTNDNVYALDVKTGKVIWRCEHGSDFSYGSLSSSYNKVYMGGYSYSAINLSDGKLLWDFNIKGSLSDITIGHNKIYFSNLERPVLYEANPNTGEIIWKSDLGEIIDNNSRNGFSRPIIADGNLYTNRYKRNRIFRVDLPSGKKVWSYDLPLNESLENSFTVSDGVIYFSTKCYTGREIYNTFQYYVYALK